MDLQLTKYNEQLRTEYKDAHEKYRRQHIKVKVTLLEILFLIRLPLLRQKTWRNMQRHWTVQL